MSVETIITKIQEDAKKQAEFLTKDAQYQAKQLQVQMNEEADKEAQVFLEAAQRDIQQKQHIKIAQANQEMKREIMAAREDLIDTCFARAQKRLQHLSGKQYHELVTALMKEGMQKLGEKCTVQICREEDKKLAKDLGLQVTGSLEASGGVMLHSADGNITLDNTFEGIIRRKKDVIRIRIGKLLFSPPTKE